MVFWRSRIAIVIALVSLLPLNGRHVALTYALNGGRLGDNIHTFTKALYCALCADIPLLYKPFPSSECFALHKTCIAYDENIAASFKHIVRVNTIEDIQHNSDHDDTLFITHFYTKTPALYNEKIHNPLFATQLDALFTPIIPLFPIQLPTIGITVALHIRTGDGVDAPLYSEQWYDHDVSQVTYIEKDISSHNRKKYADQIWPSKFPPRQYYLEQLHKLRMLLPDTPLIIVLFTDHQQPEQLIKEFQERWQDTNSSFIYYDNIASDYSGVEDLLAMSRCDCLIRSTSLFAQAAQLFGSHKISIFPLHTTWENKKLVVDKVMVLRRS